MPKNNEESNLEVLWKIIVILIVLGGIAWAIWVLK